MPEILPSSSGQASPTATSGGNGFRAVEARAHHGAASTRGISVLPTEALQPQEAGEGDVENDPKIARAEADKALLRACLSGGEAAFSALYGRLSPPLFSMIFEILKHQKDAEDVLQESFVQMWKKAPTYDPHRGNVFTWSVMIARNKAIDRLRARHRRSSLNAAAAAEAEAAPTVSAASADDLLSQRDEHDRVRAALSRIPAKQLVAIKLAFFGGLTQSEIAEELGAPLGTIKARIRRGLVALRSEVATV